MTEDPHPFSVHPDALAQVNWTTPERESSLGRGTSLLEYGGELWARAEQARAGDDEPLARAYDVIGGICRMRLDPENEEMPLGGRPDDPLGPSFWPEQLPKETVDALEDALGAIDDVWLRARIADVVHSARPRRDYKAAEQAARLLGEAAQASWEQERERAAVTFLDRALQLTGPYGPKSSARGAAIAAWRNLLGHAADIEAEPADLRALLALGLKYTTSDEETLPLLSEQTAERAEALGRWHLARQIWSMTSDWWRRMKDKEQAREAQVRAAATYERQAERFLEGGSDISHSQAVTPLSKAVIAYRQAGERERADAAHRLLQKVQRGAAQEIARFGSPIGPSLPVEDLFTAGADAVRGLPLDEALGQLVTLWTPSSQEERLAEAEKEVETYLFAKLFEDRLFNRDGKLTARGRTLWDRAVKNEAHRMRIIGGAFLSRARRQLYEEHALGHVALLTTLMHASWVPPGRARAYTRALLAGYRGDWDVMVALLGPQIEHSVRLLLHLGAGRSTSSLDDDGIQKEYGLSATLSWPEAKEVIGTDIAFALRVLLVEPMGHNLRNRSAHGLIHDGEIDGAACEYLWWLTMRLCLAPPSTVRAARMDSSPGDS